MRAAIELVLTGVVVATASAHAAGGVAPTAGEMQACREWVGPHLSSESTPFTFVYGGRASAELLPRWAHEASATPMGPDGRARSSSEWRDPATGLAVRCEYVTYRDYPVVEWVLRLRNDGDVDTPILSDVLAMDARLGGTGDGDFLLHHAVGSPCTAHDYEPLETALESGTALRIGAAGGRSTNSDLSYFSLEMPDEEGCIVAIGWPGQWASEWARDDQPGVRLRIGQEQTHFVLHPGEEVRTPMVALLFWQGGTPPNDWVRAQNVWRRWFLAHNLHRPNGQLPPTMTIGGSIHTNMMVGATEENQKQAVDAYIARGYRPDLWWMDAGWYPCNGDWTCTGTWEPDPERFPNGLAPVTAYLRERGIRSVLWFEPERVRQGTWLDTEHPEWVLRAGGGDGLLDFGNPQAWQWVTEHVDGMVSELGLDIYRQDFNTDSLAYWRANDAPDRQGITEIRYVTGMLAYWDTLLARHPGLIYDNCASGGRRNDLESMRRGVPFTKSDYADDPLGVQGETYGIAFWLPYFAAPGIVAGDVYLSRSRLAPVAGMVIDELGGEDLSPLPARRAEWDWAVKCYWGDYWPLTPYSLADDAWLSWQFDLSETGEGLVQVYRRAACAEDTLVVRMRGLDPQATYLVRDFDGPGEIARSGAELAAGLEVTIPAQPGAAVLGYRRQ